MTPVSDFRRLLPIVIPIVLAIVVRLAAMAGGSSRFADPDNYLPLARSLAVGEGLSLNGRPTAYRPPLYPLVLAPLVRLPDGKVNLGIALLHLSLGAGTAGLTWMVGRTWGFSSRRASITALIVAVDPVLAWQSRFVMTETLTAFLLIAALAAFSIRGRRGDLLFGIFQGLAVLCRPSTLPGAGLIVAARMLVGRESARERLPSALLMGIAIVGVVSPWAIRNYLVFGQPVWSTTHGGYTLALANNETYYRDVLHGTGERVWEGHDQWLWWDSVNRATAHMTEPEADRFLRDKALKLAFEQPWTFLRASIDRLGRFWSIAPAASVYSRSIRLATALWTVPLWVAFALGLSRMETRRWPQLTALLQVAGLSLVHSVYWTDLRMRAPIIPAIALIAAMALLPRKSSGRD